MSGLPIVVSGPSGVGKGTLINKICAKMPQLEVSISTTTREPRPGEKNGESYFFVSTEEFEQKIETGFFLEWAKVYDQYYGTSREFVEKVTESGNNILLELDVQGAIQLKESVSEAVLIFIAPPSLSELRRRITSRGTEKPEHIEKRMEIAWQELKMYKEYDYLVINEIIEDTVSKIYAIITAEEHRVSRNPDVWWNK